MYRVCDLYERHAKRLGLELLTGDTGLQRVITLPEVQRPGLSLCGYIKHHAGKRILIFGKVETQYLRDLSSETRLERLEALLQFPTPAVILARRFLPQKELR